MALFLLLVVIGVVVYGNENPQAVEDLEKLGDLPPGVVPLVAVAVAAALAYEWNLALKRRDEGRELRAVSRLIDAELAVAAALLDPEGPGKLRDDPELRLPPLPQDTERADVEQAGGLKRWQARRRRELLSVAEWNEHKLLLARHLKYHHWERLRSAYAAIEQAKASRGGSETSPETLYKINEARAGTLHRIDRARAVFESHIWDHDGELGNMIEAALDEAAADRQSQPPRVVGVRELGRELRSAVKSRELTARQAESLGGYLLMRSVGGVDHEMLRHTRKRRETQAREFGVVLDPDTASRPDAEDAAMPDK